MSEKNLKVCPFCGGEAKLHTVKDFQSRVFSASIECVECEASTRSYIVIDAAIEAWNRRFVDEDKERRNNIEL